ncbi:hypothetical protein JMN32_05060 [Fulvivirga sp. 29W222]|uniref:Uncharacterized protein n=1 Tax=Fulvivirga marina TaxID=2494733 RepID=A0A937KAL4_9BACT|nr:hypothetical protein [Fulvivirga marina]MBL6445666.1 hypothetical protein [Fulvivirga marina]
MSDTKTLLSPNEQKFLDYYLSQGLRSSKKVKCYRLAFGEEVEDVKDSSINTYCKVILAKDEAKKYIQKKKVTNETAAQHIMQNIEELDRIYKEDVKSVKDRIEVMKEKRLTLDKLQSMIDFKEETFEDKYILSDLLISINPDITIDDLDSSKEAKELACSALKIAGHGSLIVIDSKGAIRNITPISRAYSKELREAIENGLFKIAIDRPESD